jgi:Ca2+-binding RTX toxin-like protein
MTAKYTTKQTQSATLVFIDTGIEDWQSLAAGVRDGVAVFVLQRDRDGVEQIATGMQNFAAVHGSIDAAHIISHGSPGHLYLGSTVLGAESLDNYKPFLQQWGNSAPNILLYGCDVARGEGAAFVEKLSELTGATVAASTDKTGSPARGANWNLQYTTGTIKAPAALRREAIAAYNGVLAILTVTSTADSGAGSLREAIEKAQAGDTIKFSSSLANKTVTLTTGQLNITKNLIIDGAGAAGLTLSGNNASRVFEVEGGGLSFTLKNLTVAGGRVADDGGAILTGQKTILTVENCQFKNNAAGVGGAIVAGNFSKNTVINSKFDSNQATANVEQSGGAIQVKSLSELTVRDSEFTNNKGINGGAINSLLSRLTVENSTFINNDSTAGKALGTAATNYTKGYGGAIYTDGASEKENPDSGTILIRNSRFEDNKGAGQGGALFLFAYPPDKIIVEDSTIVNNTVIKDAKGDALGGGLRAGNGELTVSNTTFANNSAESQGGGLWVGEKSPVTIANSTFSGNRAANASDTSGLGGAMFLNNGTNPASIVNTTIANNHAGFQGGAFWGGGASITLENTIVAYNTASNGGKPWNIKQHTGYQFTDGGGNIQWPAKNPNDPTDVNVTGNVSIADPLIGPLQNNGGGTPTHALLPGSPAIDGGVPVSGVATDQRGTPRTDGKVDVGAFEFAAVAPSLFTANSDSVTLTGGNDVANALQGNDLVVALGGNDIIEGNQGNDSLYGNEGSDILTGNQGSDFLSGDAGDDILAGEGESDFLTGGSGNDALDGGLGNDSFAGGTGTDMFVIRTGDGTDLITDFGGARSQTTRTRIAATGTADTLKFQGAGLTAQNMLLTQNGADLSVKFNGVANTEVILQNFTLQNLENLLAGAGSYVTTGNILFDGNTEIQDSFDVISAAEQPGSVAKANTTTFLNDLNNSTQGKENSSDVINAQGGSDTISGLSGSDILRGGDGNDRLDGGRDGDILTGNAGRDQFVLTKSSGGDTISDFTDGEDSLILAGGLTVSQLSITSSATTRTGSSSTFIALAQTGELLATLNGVSANLIAASDFTAI